MILDSEPDDALSMPIEPAAEPRQGEKEATMRHRLLFMALVLIAVTGVLRGCQSVRVANAPEASGSSTLRFARVGTPDSGTIDRGETGSTFRFHRPLGQEDVRPAMEAASAAEPGSTFRFR